MLTPSSPARRRIPRLPSSGVWVYWEAHPHHDVSRVRDLSPAGLFLETRFRKSEGDVVQLHFLVQEGRIRADANVRYATKGEGLGLQLRAVSPNDIPQFEELLSRLRSFLPPAAFAY